MSGWCQPKLKVPPNCVIAKLLVYTATNPTLPRKHLNNCDPPSPLEEIASLTIDNKYMPLHYSQLHNNIIPPYYHTTIHIIIPL